VTEESGSGDAREIQGIRVGEKNIYVAAVGSLLTCAVMGEVEGPRHRGDHLLNGGARGGGFGAASGRSAYNGTTAVRTGGTGSARCGAVSVMAKQAWEDVGAWACLGRKKTGQA
jgi:hypothetical protein